jgi:aspartyl-tRNA(Asn)/glutamyl-tRNA(Gln) amidotransferase subunit A
VRPLPGNELCYLSIREAAQLLRRRKISTVELLNAILERIDRLNPELNAFITVAAERALADAQRAQREISRGGNRGPLHGIPLLIKDNIETQGIRTTAGSKILANFIPERDADVVSALREAGAVIVGKTNLHEFAYGITNENPHYGAARNPWDTTRVSGGSSGGSAVALASGLGFGSVGTDTGGSIRIPAALCGIVGLKPTFGRVSTRGVVPLSVSLDHVGPLARSVDDVSVLLAAISSKEHPYRAAGASKRAGKSRRMRIKLGWPRNFFFDRVDDEVLQAIEIAVKLLEKRGAQVKQISLSHIADSAEAGTHIALAEALNFHQNSGFYPARAAEYGTDVRARLEQGANIRAADYLHALESRARIAAEFDAALAEVDAIVAPSAPIAAPHIGETVVRIRGEEETVRSALVRVSRPANFTGHPAISIPCGFTSEGMPIGLQLIATHWNESKLLEIASHYESETDWHKRRPY